MSYKPKKYYIKTYGCQANIADSNTMSGILDSLGFERILPGKNYRNEKEELLDLLPKCDLFIVNTCSVRQKSEDKVYGLGRILTKIEKENGIKPHVLIAGCLVGSTQGKRKRFKFNELKRKTEWADSYAGPSEVFNLPQTLFSLGLLDEWAVKKFNKDEIIPLPDDKKQAFVNISTGCDNFCTYCVVPYTRGKEISRSEKEIIGEIKNLVSRGYTEFTLCGQNVNSWGLDMKEKFSIRTGSNQILPFAALLRNIHKIDGVEKIEFISSNPFDFTQNLIETLKLPKISSYLHIAVQSGNNDVLERMNRRHTVEDFINLVGRIREARPDIELGTDAIVGFPGETREQFMDTVRLFEKVKFKVAFISMYSSRKGTSAETNFEDNVPIEEKKWRHRYLTRVWKENKSY